MSRKGGDGFDVDALLNNLFSPTDNLNDLFEKRIKELDLAPTNALEILDIEYRALQGILHGTSKRVDYTCFIKLASFLKVSTEKVFSLYIESLERNYPNSVAYPQNKIDFINNNFDLATLRKSGFINSITDYREIEKKINIYFGFKNIFEFNLPSNEVAFSAGVIKPKNNQTRGFWIKSAMNALEEIANPYDYDRNALINYFPKIRWQSTNVELGLPSVISDLYKLGITVFYQSSLPSLHLRGATISIHNKPSIILTDYKGFYTTLWHTLCHELSHVLFDFDQIKSNTYHISDEETQQDLAVAEKEKEADNFAREYLFSKQKTLQVKPHLNNKNFVDGFAAQHQVHPSFIYTYYAYDVGKENPKAWARAKQYNPVIDSIIKQIENPWTGSKSIKEHIDMLKKNSNIYN